MRSPTIPSPAPAPPARRPLVTPARTAAVFALAAGVLTALVVARWGPLLSFDQDSADRLHHWAVDEPGLTRANRVLTDWVWDPWTMRILTAVAVLVLWFQGSRLLALGVAVATALSAAVQQGVKAAVGRERPQWPDPVDSAHFASFPSGHVMTATVTCGLLLWVLRRHGVGRAVWCAAVTVAVVSVVGVGLTRLWLGVHWSSDVLAGWLMGGCLVALFIATYGRTALSPGR